MEHANPTILPLFYDLVSIRSDTCTPMEKEIEQFIYDWLAALAYFQENEQLVGREPIPDDPLERAVVWALVRGKGEKTVVLVNHHDTVLPDNYGSLAPYAHDPFTLVDEMRTSELSAGVQQDLKRGDWIFGRGTADMKAGAAIQMAMCEEYSRKDDVEGNLLFLSVPGEEYMSIGMLNSVALMERLQKRYDLKYQLLMDSETHQRGSDNQGVIYEGSAGKLLALVYVRGVKAHVGNVFAGFNPLLLMSEIISRTEENTDFCDVVEAEVAPPPTWMFMEDRQMQYEGTIPVAAAGCLSMISLHSLPSEIDAHLIQAIKTASQHVTRKIERQKAAYNAKGITTEQIPAWDVQVMHFEELYEHAEKQFGKVFVDDYQQIWRDISRRIDENQESIQNGSYQLIEKVLDYVPDLAPVVVLAYLPPFYPSVSNWTYPALSEAVASISQTVNAYSIDAWGEYYTSQNYFMQISDMSFTAFHHVEDTIAAVGRNMPFWNKYYSSVFTSNRTLSMPVVNIGPWGKDLHKAGERVYRPDLEERTYAIMKHVIHQVLEAH